jgi:hypothetical protein
MLSPIDYWALKQKLLAYNSNYDEGSIRKVPKDHIGPMFGVSGFEQTSLN